MTGRDTMVALALAWRELRSGVKGFTVFVLCLAIGVGAIASAGSVAETFRRGLDRQARTLSGGDIILTHRQRLADDTLRGEVAESGAAVSEIITADAMARSEAHRGIVDVKAVDAAYPLVGALELEGESNLPLLFGEVDGVWGAAAGASLFGEFGVRIGDRIDVAGAVFEIRARIRAEPDALGEGGFWPRLLVSIPAARAMGVSGPGSLFNQSFNVTLPDGASAAADLEAWRATHESRFEDAGLRVRDRRDANDRLKQVFDTLEVFLAVVGLAAIVAGGLGVSQATTAFLETRTASIAVLKALGADAGQIRLAYLVQIGGLALFGVVLGLVVGALSPWAVVNFLDGRLTVPSALGIYPRALVKAAVLGLLAAFVFALPAIGRARATPPAALFRGAIGDERRPPLLEIGLAAGCAAVFALVAAATSPRPLMTLSLLGGAGLVFVMLGGVARLVMWAARRIAPRTRGFAALALANLGGPGSIAPIAAPALGLGAAILTLIVLVEANLVHQIRDAAPSDLPSLVFTQIPGGESARFDAVLAGAGAPTDDINDYRRTVMTSARIVALNGRELTRGRVAQSERWIVEREISVSRAAAKPPETTIEAGSWWPDDYTGAPLVSLERDLARGIGARIGDQITLNVLGRDVEARVASLRATARRGFGANFAAIFSPGAIDAALPPEAAILRVEEAREGVIADAVGAAFPRVLVLRTRAALARVGLLLDDIAMAVSFVAFVVAIAGGLVLVGAFAAAARRRAREAALLKTLGATPGNVLALFSAEAGLAGMLASALGALFGGIAAYLIVVHVFEADWIFPWRATGRVILAGAAAAALGGGLSAAASLARPAARVLRQQ